MLFRSQKRDGACVPLTVVNVGRHALEMSNVTNITIKTIKDFMICKKKQNNFRMNSKFYVLHYFLY